MSWIRDVLFKDQTDLKEVLKRRPVILDVRRPDEFEAGHISGAVHIPLYELDERIDEVHNLGEPVVAYCRSGVRSGKAVAVLKAYGIEAHNGGGMGELTDLL